MLRELIAAAVVSSSIAVKPGWAEEKKEKKEPPRVTMVVPLGVVAGTTNTILIRGLSLTNATEIRFPQAKFSVEWKIKSKGKADVPKDQDAKKIGDTQVELDLAVRPETPEGTLSFTVITPEGETEPHSVLIFDGRSLILEKEPNGGFRTAQEISLPQTVQGSIREANDVDVFRFEGRAGQKIKAEVLAARYGSALDSLLTLYDAGGHILSSNDDHAGSRDSLLQVALPSDGLYLLSLVDAQDRGSPAHVYELVVGVEK